MGSEETVTARPGRPKSEEKRCAILEAAGTSFLERGLEDTSMDRVAREAGVSKQTVYSHFQSKEALFEAVIENKCRAYDRGEEPGSGGDDRDPAEVLLAFTRRYLDLALDAQVIAMARQVIAQSVHGSAMAELYEQAGTGRTIARLERLLEAEHDAGRLRIDDAATAAADYVHETGARFKNELLTQLRDAVPSAERETHAQRRVREFMATHGVA